MPPAGTWPAATPLELGEMPPSTQRMPPLAPLSVSSITNSTSSTALAGTFSQDSAGEIPAPAHVYLAGIGPLRANSGLDTEKAPGVAYTSPLELDADEGAEVDALAALCEGGGARFSPEPVYCLQSSIT